MPHIFVDETGHFEKHNDEKYFIVACFTVGEPARTRKRFRAWLASRFPKKMRHNLEIKFSDKISDGLRLRTLQYIASLDVRVQYVFLLKQNIPTIYLNDDKIKTGHLYTQVVGEVLKMFTPISDLEFRIFCDQRRLKGLRQADFREMLKTHLLPSLPSRVLFQCEMVDSKVNPNIQIADWINGALAAYLEGKVNGQECYNLLKNNIVGSKELFKNYWEERYK